MWRRFATRAEDLSSLSTPICSSVIYVATPKPTVILVGAGPRVVVTVARSLARHGARCIVAVTPGQRFSVRSSAVEYVTQLEGSPAAAGAMLVMLASAERAAWIVPCTDGALTIIAQVYDELARITAVGCPRPEIVQRVLDKEQTLAAAIRCGVPVPASVSISTGADIDAAAVTLRFPIIAKPGDRGVEARHTFKTRTFHDVEELRDAFAQDAAFGDGLLFQRYQSGDGVGVEVMMSNGSPVAHFQHRRLAELPASGGVCVYGVSETADPMLLEHAVRLLRELHWDGVAMVEFRHDRKTNEAALLEVNGRFWGSIALPVMAGVDFPSLAWRAARGLEPGAPGGYRSGIRFRWTAGALMRFALAFGPEHSEGFSRWKATRDLLMQLRPGIRSALWDWSDPLPALQEVADILGGWIRNGVKAAISATIPRSVLATLKTSRNLPAGRGRHYLGRRLARRLALAPKQRLPGTINSVVFVCHGNIMRSAAAGRFLSDILASAGITDVRVESAGAHTSVGRLADARVKQAVLAYGGSLEQHRSQPLTRELVDRSDVIFVMDDLNFVDVTAEYPHARAKVRMLRGVEMMGEDGRYVEDEITDPYGRSTDNVRSTIANVHESVSAVGRAILRMRGSNTQRRVGSQTAAR